MRVCHIKMLKIYVRLNVEKKLKPVILLVLFFFFQMIIFLKYKDHCTVKKKNKNLSRHDTNVTSP